MYKPHYLNVERTTKRMFSGNKCYWSKTTTEKLGRKRKPPEKIESKSGRRFCKCK